jgi:hypothetical protein
MARRGRFGRSETGSSNLSATIAALIRQQREAEERLILDAYYSQIPYNGSVPTIDDIMAFYNNAASLIGAVQGTNEYEEIFQKKNSVNNYDIKRTYNELIADFNQSKGENYKELIDFLDNRATTSTNQEDLDSYVSGLDEATSAYIRFQGESLVRGEITAKEYQRITLEGLAALEPGSDGYETAIYDALQYEWTAESRKWSNRVTAGTATAAQFAAWGKSFANRVLRSGVSKDSDLYTSIGATVSNQSGGSGRGSEKKLSRLAGDLNDLFVSASAQLGFEIKGNVTDILTGSNDTDVLDRMAEQPQVFAALFEFMDDNPGYTNPILAKLGIESGDDGRAWLDKNLRVGLYEAQISGKDVDKWTGANRTNGSLSSLDEFTLASSKWIADKTAAAGDKQLLSFYNNEWKKYLATAKTGLYLEESIYGSAPTQWATEGQVSLYLAEVDAAFGNSSPGTQTISGTLDSRVDEDWVNFDSNDEESAALSSGRAVLVYDKETNSYTYEGVQADGLSRGSYQYVEMINVGGKVIGRTISVRGVPIYDNNGAIVAYRYEMPENAIKVIDTKGFVIDAPTIERSPEGFVTGKDGLGVQGEAAPTSNIDKLITRNRVPFNPEDPEQRRALILAGEDPNTVGYDPAYLDAAAIAFDLAKGGLGQETLYAGTTEPSSGPIIKLSNQLKADKIAKSPRGETFEGKQEIATLLGDTAKAEGYKFFVDNADKITTINGIPQLKPEFANQPQKERSLIDSLMGVVAGSVPIVGPLLGIGAQAAQGVGLFSENLGMQFTAAQEKILTPEQKAARASRVGATPQAQAYQQTGYPAVANTFFRNISAPSSPAMTGASTYLGTQATVSPVMPPPPPISVAPRPRPKTARTVFTPEQLTQSAIDFRAGERNMK